MKFAAIDFETANHHSDSPCQVAVVWVEDGRRIDEQSWLIRPRNLYFSERCIAVHGIRPRDVIDQPEWDQVWSELAPLIEGYVLIAHNAMFDMAVLASTLVAYELVCPRIEFQCTRLMARRCWPGRTGYGLKPTADALGISFQHHIAVEDARACAEVALAAARSSRAETLEGLESVLSIQRGRIEFGNRVGPRCIHRSKTLSRNRSSNSKKTVACSAKLQAETILEGCGSVKPLENKRVFLTGTLLGLEHAESTRFLQNLGGTVETALSATTQYWIVGSASEESSRNVLPQGPHAMNAAEVMASQDQPTLIISQRQLLAMIPGGLEAARCLSGAQ